MDISSWFSSLADSVGNVLPGLIGALVILLVGWIIALIAGALVKRGLGALKTNERIGGGSEASIDVEKIASSIVFWVIFLFALIGAFNMLQLEAVSAPLGELAETIMLYLPRLLMAAVLALVAWVVATLVRTVVGSAANATGLDRRLSQTADVQPLSQTLGNVLFWFVILLFIPAIVGVLQVEGLMQPLSDMIAAVLAALPNILAAAIIGFIGWLIAKVLSSLVTNLLAAVGADRLTEGSEATEGVQLSRLGGTLVFILVLVPALIAALDALQMEAISAPARDMLGMFLEAVPNIVAAAAILAIAWFVGRFVADLLTQLLASLGFDNLPARLGFGDAFASGTDGGLARPSRLAAQVAFFFVMLFAVVEAANRLGFAGVSELVETFIAFGSNVLLGAVILAVGYWLANLAASAVARVSGESVAQIVRIAILGLVLAMGLRAMGIADEIVNLAFGLVLGAVAVAVALAFGLGGREAAGQVAQNWADRLVNKSSRPKQ